MFKKILMLAGLAITSLAISETASAQCGYGGYGNRGSYRGPAVVYRSPRSYHRQYQGVGAYRAPVAVYGSPYGVGSRYGSRYGGYPYGGYGYGAGYFNRGSSVGIGRGGVSFRIGF